MHTRFDAIIIGAGPAGSSAAILLAQAGWSVALVEKQQFPRRKVCGECIAASNLPIIERLGLGRAFEALAGPELRHVALMHADETVSAALPQFTDPGYRWGRALGREHLDLLLLERAMQLGVHVFQPWRVEAVSGKAGAFTCLIHHLDAKADLQLHAAILIGANGSWEAAPYSTHHEKAPARPSDLFAFKANFINTQLAEGLLPVLAFAGGYGGMVVADHGVTTLACCIRRDRLEAWRKHHPGQSAGEAMESYLKQHCRGVQQALAGAERQGRWLGSGPIKPGIRIPRGGSEVFLIGNAAGEAHPIIGEGISMAMQSAWLLSECLSRERGVLAGDKLHRQVQQEYAQAWHRHFAKRIHIAATFANLAMRPGLGTQIISLLRIWPGLMTYAARWSGKVDTPLASARTGKTAVPDQAIKTNG